MSFNRIFDKLDEIVESISDMKEDQAVTKAIHSVNSKNLETHIKRTNKIESKQQKIIYLIMIGAGAVAVYFGPAILRIVGILI